MCHTCREGIIILTAALYNTYKTPPLVNTPHANKANIEVVMEASSSRVVVMQVLLLALVVQVTLSQHWSYGWLPGGKRSVGELEATIRMMGTGGVVSLPEEASARTQERPRPYSGIDGDFTRFDRKKRFPDY